MTLSISWATESRDSRGVERCLRRRAGRVLFCVLALAALCLADQSMAAVTSTGDVNPIPPAGGGSLVANLIVGAGNTAGDFLIGTVRIDDGTSLEDSDGIVGDRAGALGQVTVNGSDSLWAHRDDLFVGQSGIGQLLIEAMGRVDVADDMLVGGQVSGLGTVAVDGFVSVLDVIDDLTVGSLGEGGLTATNQAFVFSRDAWIGRELGSRGTVSVEDSGSRWSNNQSIIVGSAGGGALNVVRGGRVESSAGVLGELAGGAGAATVDGLGSRWETSGNLTVGSAGDGTLEILDEGEMDNLTGNVGGAATGVGLVFVEGRHSLWRNRDDLNIGVVGSGQVTLRDEAQMLVSDRATVGLAGEVVLETGRIDAALIENRGVIRGYGDLTGAVTNTVDGEIRGEAGGRLVVHDGVTNQGRLESLGGEMEFQAAVTNAAATGQIAASDAVLRFSGGLTNSGTLALSFGTTEVFGTVTTAAGGAVLVAGDSGATFFDPFANSGNLVVLPGATAVFVRELNFTTTAALTAELAGTIAGQSYPQIQVGGSAALAGTLDVRLATGFEPQAGDRFQLLAAGSGVSGDFSKRLLPDLGDGLQWDVQVGPTGVSLFVTLLNALLGDLDCDGDVDFDDIGPFALGLSDPAAYEAVFGLPPTVKGDLDDDGDFDFDDIPPFVALLGGTNGSASQHAVPEPASGSLAAAALLLAVAVRHGNVILGRYRIE